MPIVEAPIVEMTKCKTCGASLEYVSTQHREDLCDICYRFYNIVAEEFNEFDGNVEAMLRVVKEMREDKINLLTKLLSNAH